jgi:hypothetical protein
MMIVTTIPTTHDTLPAEAGAIAPAWNGRREVRALGSVSVFARRRAS